MERSEIAMKDDELLEIENYFLFKLTP